MSDANATSGPVLAADGTPLKKSLGRALRMEKMRALALIAPLLIFVLVSFILPIASMLFRSVENQIVGDTIPDSVAELASWDSTTGQPPDEAVFKALYFDLFVAAEAKEHTKLGSRLNYENPGIASLFRASGRKLDDLGKDYNKAFKKIDPALDDGAFWFEMMSGEGAPATNVVMKAQASLERLTGDNFGRDIGFVPGAEISSLLPETAKAYAEWAAFTAIVDEDVVAEEDPWEAVYVAFAEDLKNADVTSYQGPGAEVLTAAKNGLDTLPLIGFREFFLDIDEDWGNIDKWQTVQIYSPSYTSGYFLNSIDLMKTPDGIEVRPENQQIYLTLFKRTLIMSMIITGACILLGYPIAFLLANLPMRTANVLMILVLLPFWTSLLVRTSAWKVMLQQQGVINDVLVWVGLVADDARLVMINNQFGTIVAMTHILLPFMILPMYSVMQTIPPTYVRAAKSMGATNWTSFWRVYFPLSVPGIGAGSILVFILAIGYYITPEIVGGTKGVFISNRIAYHISSSLNWGLAAALGTILLCVVLILYWAYDKIVGIDNVKLGG